MVGRTGAGRRLLCDSASSQLLREVPGSLRALALQVGEVGYPAMGAAVRMIQTGEPAFNLVFGAVWEEHLAIDPHARARFNRLVAARKELLADHLLDHRWTGRETVIDLGGGDGALLQGLLARRPRLRGVVFDLPDVVAEAAERLRAAGLGDRCQTVAGNFFRDIPQGGDVYLLSHGKMVSSRHFRRVAGMPRHGRRRSKAARRRGHRHGADLTVTATPMPLTFADATAVRTPVAEPDVSARVAASTPVLVWVVAAVATSAIPVIPVGAVTV
jgi:hypothetical protein